VAAYEDIPGDDAIRVNWNDEGTRQAALQEMIYTLPERTRMVFNLYAIEGYTHPEISNLLGIAEGTSKWHLSDARSKLQEQLVKMDSFGLMKKL
jgi:RNA polymerase sigma-70 factor (ECF subfamily)